MFRRLFHIERFPLFVFFIFYYKGTSANIMNLSTDSPYLFVGLRDAS